MEVNMEKKIAIITARGGSKRIPKKNIKEFCGKPIIAYSIEAALESGIFDEVMVSTDSEEIAEVAKAYGAKVPFMRSEKTSDDFATTADVLMEVIEEYKKRGETFTHMACIYPTAPFVTAKRLKEAMNLLIEEKSEGVVPVVKFSFPPQRCYIINEIGKLQFKWEEYRNSRSQDLEPFYHDAGQYYFFNVDAYVAAKGQLTEMTPLILEESEVQDIDSPEDFKIAQMKYQILHESENK